MPKACSYCGDVLAEHVPQRLGLLRAQVDGLVVSDGDLVGTLAGSQSEDELKIPHADAHLHAVGVGLAVIGRLGEIELGLLRRSGLMTSSDYSPEGRGALGHALTRQSPELRRWRSWCGRGDLNP